MIRYLTFLAVGDIIKPYPQLKIRIWTVQASAGRKIGCERGDCV